MTILGSHPPLSPDQAIEVTIGFEAIDAVDEGWSQPTERALELHAQLVSLGGFVEACPQLRWRASVGPASAQVLYERLPGDPSSLALLVRMLLALPRSPLMIEIRGTPLSAGARVLPPTASALGLLPRNRTPHPFALELEPVGHWLCVDVSNQSGLDLASAALIDERIELWCALARAGALCDVAADGSVAPASVGKSAPAIGVDFYATEIMHASLALAAPSVLVNLIDMLARTSVHIDELWIR